MKLLHRDFHIDFMGKKKIFFIISAACMVIIALWGVIFGVDLDISFKGGTIFTYTYSDANAELDQGALASAAQEVLGEEVEVEPKQDLASNTPTLDISMTSAVTMEESSIDELTAALQEAAPDLGLEDSTITSVNPSIGMDFFGKCLVAVGVGIIIMIIYLGIRFRLINGWKAAITAVLCVLLVLFLRTQLGLSLRATGDNRDMVSASSINPAFTTTVGLCLSNAVVALSGALIAQYQKFADNTLGTGMVVIGLASLIIGEVLFGRDAPHFGFEQVPDREERARKLLLRKLAEEIALVFVRRRPSR